MPVCEKGKQILEEAMKEAVSESEQSGGKVTVIKQCDHVSTIGYVPIPCFMSFIAVAQEGKLTQAGIYGGHYCADLNANKPNTP